MNNTCLVTLSNGVRAHFIEVVNVQVVNNTLKVIHCSGLAVTDFDISCVERVSIDKETYVSSIFFRHSVKVEEPLKAL